MAFNTLLGDTGHEAREFFSASQVRIVEAWPQELVVCGYRSDEVPLPPALV